MSLFYYLKRDIPEFYEIALFVSMTQKLTFILKYEHMRTKCTDSNLRTFTAHNHSSDRH